MMKLFSKNKAKEVSAPTAAASGPGSSKESAGKYNIKEKSLDKIYKAAWIGDVKKLSNFQSDVNAPDSEKRTALHLACANGQERAVDVLLSMGADATAHDKWDKTPLYRAVQANHALCIRLLLKKAPDLTKDESLSSLLHIAVQNGSTETLAALLTSLANSVDSADSSGRTALMLACEAGRASMAAALLDKGASLTARDSAGRSCSDYAKSHPDCLKILESRRSGRAGASKPLTPRTRTSSDYEDDESKSTDYDIPVPRVAGRSRSPVVALVGGRKAISLNELHQGETSVQVFDPETEMTHSLKVPIVRDKRKRSRSQSPAVSLTVSVDSFGSDDEAAGGAAVTAATGDQNKSSSRAEPPPLRKSLAAVPEAPPPSQPAATAATPKKTTPARTQPAQTPAAAAVAASGNESDSDWSNSQSAAAPESGGRDGVKPPAAKINLKLGLEKHLAAAGAAAAHDNNGDNAQDDDYDDDDDNTVASDFPPTTAPTPRSVGKATPRDARQDSDWEASEISEAAPPPKAKKEPAAQVAATKADEDESDWDESVAVSTAAKGPDKVKPAGKLSAAAEDESDWDNSITEAPSSASAVQKMSKSKSTAVAAASASATATVNLGASTASVAKDEISNWDSATEDVASSAAVDAASPRKQQQLQQQQQQQQQHQQPPDSARNQGGLQPIEEEAAAVAAAIAAAAPVDLQQQPQATSKDGGKTDALEFWDSEASLAASDGPPSNRQEPQEQQQQQRSPPPQKQPEESKEAFNKVEAVGDDTDTDEDIDFARDGGGNVTIKFAGDDKPNEEDDEDNRLSASSPEAEQSSHRQKAAAVKADAVPISRATVQTPAAAVTLSKTPSSPRAPSPLPASNTNEIIRLQSEVTSAVADLAESRAEAARLSTELELVSDQLAEARRRQSEAEAGQAAAQRRLEAERAEATRLTERLRLDAAGSEEAVRGDLRRERAVSAEASLALEAARAELADLRRRLELERDDADRMRAELAARVVVVATNGANGDSAAAAAAEALAELSERLAETRAELAAARTSRAETLAAAEAAARAAHADGEQAGSAELARRTATRVAEALAESAEVGEAAPALRSRMRKLLGLPDLGPEFETVSFRQQRSTPAEAAPANQSAAPSPPPQPPPPAERAGLTLEFRNGHDSSDAAEAVTADAVRHMSPEQLRQACLQLSATSEHHRQNHDQERRLRRKLTEELQRLSNAEAHAAAALSLEKERARAVASSRAFLADAHLTGLSRPPPLTLGAPSPTPPPPPPPPHQQQQPTQQQQQQLDAFLLERLRAELNRSISKHLESEDATRRSLVSSRARSTTRLPDAGTAGESDFSYLTYLKRKYLV